jgi:type II secretory pathway component PulF
MLSKVLSDIGNVSIYPVVTLVIFFSIFMLMLIMVLRGDKAQYAKMAALPLEEGQGEAPQRR